MFGYIRPLKAEMLVRDFEAYRVVYCSLCKQLGKSYGLFASLILSYDLTFYAILSMSVMGECNKYRTGRCRANPFKRCNFCEDRSRSLESAAALSVVTFYYKLKDDALDGGICKRILVKFIKPFANSWRKKLLKYGYGELDNIFYHMTKNQIDIEYDNDCSIDKSAEPSATALAQVCSGMSDDRAQCRVLENFGYYLGKWIYLMDAADDIADDIKSGNFNPFVKEFSLELGYDNGSVALQCNSILNEVVYMLVQAYDLIDLKGNRRILDNIVKQGLSSAQKQVLFDKNDKNRKNKKSD